MAYQLPGRPLNAFSADDIGVFMDEHCHRCIRDAEEDCPILAAAFRGGAHEWRILPDGKSCCTQFSAHGEPVRCPNTLELPL